MPPLFTVSFTARAIWFTVPTTSRTGPAQTAPRASAAPLCHCCALVALRESLYVARSMSDGLSDPPPPADDVDAKLMTESLILPVSCPLPAPCDGLGGISEAPARASSPAVKRMPVCRAPVGERDSTADDWHGVWRTVAQHVRRQEACLLLCAGPGSTCCGPAGALARSRVRHTDGGAEKRTACCLRALRRGQQRRRAAEHAARLGEAQPRARKHRLRLRLQRGERRVGVAVVDGVVVAEVLPNESGGVAPVAMRIARHVRVPRNVDVVRRAQFAVRVVLAQAEERQVPATRQYALSC